MDHDERMKRINDVAARIEAVDTTPVIELAEHLETLTEELRELQTGAGRQASAIRAVANNLGKMSRDLRIQMDDIEIPGRITVATIAGSLRRLTR